MLVASSSRFHPTAHACAWFAWAPPGAHASFSAGRSLSSPTRWAPLTGTTPFLQLRPLRSLTPRASPYSRTPVARRPRAVALLGFRPSRASSRSEPRVLHDLANHSVRRGASARVVERGYLSSTGEVATASRPRRPRWRFDAQSDRAPSRAASRRHPCLPRPWRPCGMNAGCVVRGGVKASTSRPSPRDEHALLGFLASSAASRSRAPLRPWPMWLAGEPCAPSPRARPAFGPVATR